MPSRPSDVSSHSRPQTAEATAQVRRSALNDLESHADAHNSSPAAFLIALVIFILYLSHSVLILPSIVSPESMRSSLGFTEQIRITVLSHSLWKCHSFARITRHPRPVLCDRNVRREDRLCLQVSSMRLDARCPANTKLRPDSFRKRTAPYDLSMCISTRARGRVCPT